MKNRQYIYWIIFSLLIANGLFFHEPWRDEIHIWSLVVNSNSLPELLHNFKAEEHPKLWYFILYFLSKISHSLFIKKLFTFFLSVTSAFILIRKLNFSTSIKILILFSYYLIFEYTLISRVYSLELFCIILFMFFYQRSKTINWSLCTPIFILAQTTILGTIISSVLLFYLLLENFNKKTHYLKLTYISSGIIIALLNSISGTLEWGYFDTLSSQNILYDLEWYSHQISTIWKGFVPIPNFFEFHFWNTNIIDSIDIKYLQNQFGYFSILEPWLYLKRTNQLIIIKLWSYIILSTLVLIGIIISFWKDKKILFLFFLGAVPMWILFAFIWHGSVRHHGHFFLLFLVCYWLLTQNGNQTKFSKVFLTSILLLQLPGGIYAYYMDYKYEFSGSGKVANYINDNFNKDTITIAGGYDYAITPISYHLDKEFYNPQSDQFNSFINWSRPEDVAFDKVSNKVGSIKPDVFICSKPYQHLFMDYLKRASESQLSIWKNYKKEDFKSVTVEKSEEYVIYSKSTIGLFFPEKNNTKKEFDSINIAFNIDIKTKSNGVFILSGWAIDPIKKIRPEIRLKSSKYIYFKPYQLKIERQDISQQYINKDIEIDDDFGFKIIIDELFIDQYSDLELCFIVESQVFNAGKLSYF